MGLLLSVFVVFVSVLELLTVYSDFQRRLQPINSDRDFSPLIQRYEAGLHKERRRILKILGEHRKFEKIAERQTEGAPSTFQPDAHQSTTSHFGRKLKENVLSRSPSPAIPAVPRNSFSIESTEDQHDEPNHICPPQDVVEGKNEDKLHILSRNITKDDNFEKITNALKELVSSKSNIEENVILHEIAPNVSTVSIKEDALEVASKSEIVTKRKKEEIEIRKLCFEKKLLSVERPLKITSRHENLDVIVYDEEVSNKKEKISKEDSINVMPEYSGLEITSDTQIAQQKSFAYDKEKLASNEEIDTGKGDDIQPHIFKTEVKTVLKEDSLDIVPEHNLEVVSDNRVSDITQKQIPLNDEEIVPKGSSLHTVSEHNVEINNDSLQIISDHIDKTDKSNDNKHQAPKIEKEDSLVIVAGHESLEISSEDSKAVQQQVTNDEKKVVSAEIIPEHINLNEKYDNIQQQVSKSEDEQIISKEDSLNTVFEHNLEMNNVEKTEIIQQLKNENEEVISKEDPFQIISEHIDDTNKVDDIKQQVFKNEKQEIVSKEDHLNIISEPNNLKIIKDSKNDQSVQLQLFTNDDGKVLSKEERFVPKEDFLSIVSEHVQQNVSEEVIFDQHKNDNEKRDSVQQQVCTTEEERVISKEDSLNISSQHNKNDILQLKMPVNDEKEVVLQASPKNIISEYNTLVIINDTQQSKVVQHELPQKNEEKLVSEGHSLEAISEHKNDTEKSDSIQQTEEEQVLPKEDFPAIIHECILQQKVPANNEIIILNQQKVSQNEDEKLILKEEPLQVIPEPKSDDIQQQVCKTKEEPVIRKEDSLNSISEQNVSDIVQQKVCENSEEVSPINIISVHNILEIISDVEEGKVVQQEGSQKENEKFISKAEPLQAVPEPKNDTEKSDYIRQEVCKTEAEQVSAKEDSLNVVSEHNRSDIVQQKMPENSEKVILEESSINTISEYNNLEVISDHQESTIFQRDDEKLISKEDSSKARNVETSDGIQQEMCKIEEQVIAKQDSADIVFEQHTTDIVQQKMPVNIEEIISETSSVNIISEQNNLEIISDFQEDKVIPQQVSHKIDEKSISKQTTLQTIPEHKNDTENKDDSIQQEVCKHETEQAKEDSLDIIPEYDSSDTVQLKVSENGEGQIIPKEDSFNNIHKHNNTESVEIINNEAKCILNESSLKSVLEHIDDIKESNNITQQVPKTEEVIVPTDNGDITQQTNNAENIAEKLPPEEPSKTSDKHISKNDAKNIKKCPLEITRLEGVKLHSITFDSVDYWPNKASIGKKKGKSKDKGSRKHVKFGLHIQELEPEWSRTPSPIFKLINSPSGSEVHSPPAEEPRVVNIESLQITDLSRQVVTEDYWRRSPSPFRDFLEPSTTAQTVSEDEDHKESSLHLLRELEKPEVISWDPNRKILSSDEETEIPFSLDEEFINTLDGLKPSRLEEKRRSRRRQGRKSSKQNSLESDSKTNNSGISESSLLETEVAETSTNKISSGESKSIRKVEKKNLPVEDLLRKQENSASCAFWLIFSGEYTKAMNKDWHGQHFCCWQCDESLTGQRYVLREEHPYCVACYESVFANSCEKCSRTIGIDSKDLSYKDKHWHEACFLCATCGDSLVDKQFGSKGDRIYCGRCYDEQFASRCDGCGQIFRAGTKKMEYKTRQWHEKCFCCCVCKTPIGTQSFIPREQEIYCAKCYEEKYATRCIKCNKVITSGGVTYKNEPWHRECFTCTHCNTSLAGARFTSRDDKPYCAECFGELFAKRCTACNKPITGIGGTKFISFEDRHWHNDCFFCASCRTSLVGRGFITDGDDIICPECAKQKLM